jgi:hypothetical protein
MDLVEVGSLSVPVMIPRIQAETFAQPLMMYQGGFDRRLQSVGPFHEGEDSGRLYLEGIRMLWG